MARILIIDDDPLMCQSLSLVATRKGHEAGFAVTLQEGLAKARSEPWDVLFLDVRMPDGNGLEALPLLEKVPSAPEIIIMTGYGDPHGAELAIKSGAWDYLEKGASSKEITLSLLRALQYRKQKLQTPSSGVVALKRDEIVGNSGSLSACLDQVADAAGSDASVLICGETGTGKELFARAVHQNSRRSRGDFVVVDCAALPENLVESVLFGHEKGIFTGADHAREGLVRQADGGTLFLDEVGELPLGLQRAFLRVLQEHRYRPLGSSREVESDFRLVAATNRDLEKMVAEGGFRGDLLFRLRSFLIDLPSLRQRRDDIRPLARHYVDRICDQNGLGAKGFSPEFLKMLHCYPWPGNVRELVNTLERAVAAAHHEPILFPKHLPVNLRIDVTTRTLRGETPSDSSGYDEAVNTDLPPLHQFRDSVCCRAEKQYLHDLMTLARNDIAEACRVSGLSQSRLYALLKKQGISLEH